VFPDDGEAPLAPVCDTVHEKVVPTNTVEDKVIFVVDPLQIDKLIGEALAEGIGLMTKT
jgi:hypothetical protein